MKLKDFKKFLLIQLSKTKRKEWPFSEGCLSIPGIRRVIRNPVSISYFDENWTFHEETLGIAARIIQHEYDHIEGVLFTDHLNPFKRRLLKKIR